MTMRYEYTTNRGTLRTININEQLYNLLVRQGGEERAKRFITSYLRNSAVVNSESVSTAILRQLCGSKRT